MSREDPYFRLRFPESLKALVEAASQRNKRSMTAEIISRLEASFLPQDVVFSNAQEAEIRKVAREVALNILEQVEADFEAERVEKGLAA